MTTSISANDCKFCQTNHIGVGMRGDCKTYLYCTKCEAQGPVSDTYEEAKRLWNGEVAA